MSMPFDFGGRSLHFLGSVFCGSVALAVRTAGETRGRMPAGSRSKYSHPQTRSLLQTTLDQVVEGSDASLPKRRGEPDRPRTGAQEPADGSWCGRAADADEGDGSNGWGGRAGKDEGEAADVA
jgi:hypothetical protein